MKRSTIVAAVSITLIFVSFAACGKAPKVCDPDSLLSKAQLCTDRDSLGFGQEFGSGTFIGTDVPESLSIRNGGIAPLNISAVTTSGDSQFRYIASWDDNSTDGMIPATTVPGNKTVFIQVFFKPTQAKAYTGSLVITSDAENAPTKTLAVTGCGVPTDGGTSPCYCKPAGRSCSVSESSFCCSGTCTVGSDGNGTCN